MNRIWLFNRPNDEDQVTFGKVVFGDGTSIRFGALPDHGDKGLELSFPSRNVEELTIHIQGKKKSGLFRNRRVPGP